MSRKKKDLTEEEKKDAKRLYDVEYRKKNKKKIANRMTDYYQKNKDKYAEYREKNKEKILKYNTEYYQNNKEKFAKYYTEYRTNNKKEIHERSLEYYNTTIGRANTLVRSYNSADKKYNRGECTLTGQWIVDNIFTKTCHYCGEDDWKKLGCDRIDNALPHTPENVLPCCKDCNLKKGTTEYNEFMRLIGKIA